MVFESLLTDLLWLQHCLCIPNPYMLFCITASFHPCVCVHYTFQSVALNHPEVHHNMHLAQCIDCKQILQLLFVSESFTECCFSCLCRPCRGLLSHLACTFAYCARCCIHAVAYMLLFKFTAVLVLPHMFSTLQIHELQLSSAVKLLWAYLCFDVPATAYCRSLDIVICAGLPLWPTAVCFCHAWLRMSMMYRLKRQVAYAAGMGYLYVMPGLPPSTATHSIFVQLPATCTSQLKHSKPNRLCLLHAWTFSS